MFDLLTTSWTFLGGGTTSNQAGSSQLVPFQSGAAVFPSSRESAAMIFSARTGSLWIFGGQGLDSSGVNGQTNDLWTFDLTTSIYTYISGSAREGTAGSLTGPGARAAASLSLDVSANKAYMYGGYLRRSADQYESSYADLWVLDLETRNFTYASGPFQPTNIPGSYNLEPGVNDGNRYPGARYSHTSIMLDQNLYIFGGRGYSSYSFPMFLSDLWAYSPQNKTWTWMNGTKTYEEKSGPFPGPDPVYAFPASRYQHGSVVTSDGRIIVIFGVGSTDTGSGILNDMYVIIYFCSRMNLTPSSNSYIWEMTCQPGSFAIEGGVCTQCPADTYKSGWSTGNVSLCLSCPAFSLAGRGTPSISQCLCISGKFLANGQCIKCPANTFKSSIGNAECTACNSKAVTIAGQGNGTSASECVCRPGYFGTGNNDCSLCPANTFKSLAGNDLACLYCNANSSTNATVGRTSASECLCLPGYSGFGHSSCLRCPASTFKSVSGNGNSSDVCTPCPTDSSSTTGVTAQSLCNCNAGFFGLNGGATTCSKCPSTNRTKYS